MKKKLLLAASIILAASSCSQSTEFVETYVKENNETRATVNGITSINIVLDADQPLHIDDNTRITVEYIEIAQATDDGTMQRLLKLTNDAKVEGSTGLLAESLQDPGDAAIVSQNNWTEAMVTGITSTAQSIYASTATPIYLSPTTSQQLYATIAYYTNTKDDQLASGVSRVRNVERRMITCEPGTQAGQAYSITLTIGLSSINVEADVEGRLQIPLE